MPISSIIPLVFLFITPCPSWLSSPTSVVLLLLTSSQICFPQSISHPFILPFTSSSPRALKAPSIYSLALPTEEQHTTIDTNTHSNNPLSRL
ncbi:hypothetical protein CTAM01_01330 [Colletotrichum tamarilloi]|uniref:Secreted protein n=1 Tax=Colletotrichum tamarilloi TaxID=1209934 RepID=A0ABQ9RQW8_9PEZI|nr:uncharacterized protein CTAM01_01330 [Colletotrichum tamarilloi]KAK1510757.1 hypothetical protein CTAM01_01330 [Colletotrichum tamarilloi]